MTSEQADRIDEKLDRIAEGRENFAGKKKKDDFDNAADEDSEKEKQNVLKKRPPKDKKGRQTMSQKKRYKLIHQTSPAGHALRRSQLLIAL